MCSLFTSNQVFGHPAAPHSPCVVNSPTRQQLPSNCVRQHRQHHHRRHRRCPVGSPHAVQIHLQCCSVGHQQRCASNHRHHNWDAEIWLVAPKSLYYRTIPFYIWMLFFLQSTPVQWPPTSHADNHVSQVPGPKPKISLLQQARADDQLPPEPKSPSHGILKSNEGRK